MMYIHPHITRSSPACRERNLHVGHFVIGSPLSVLTSGPKIITPADEFYYYPKIYNKNTHSFPKDHMVTFKIFSGLIVVP